MTSAAFAPGDRVLVTWPHSPSREGEYVEDRGTRCRVLLDGDTETCVVLKTRVRPVTVRVARWVSEHAVSGVILNDATLVEIPPHLEVTGIDHATRTISVGLRAVPKPPKPWRSDAYRAFVRDQAECACCGGSSGYGPYAMEAHHHGPHAMGRKAGDEKCIPLLQQCHRHFHDHGTFRDMDRAQTDAIAERVQAELVTAWCYMTLGATETYETIVTALINHIRESQT